MLHCGRPATRLAPTAACAPPGGLLRSRQAASQGTGALPSLRLAANAGRRSQPPRPMPPPTSLPGQAVERAMQALKDEGKPTDKELAAAAATAPKAAGAAGQSVCHSTTALGWLFHEAPLRTFLPLLACAAAAAAGIRTGRPQVVWAASGGAAAFLLTTWEVVAPLVRRFIALRKRLLDADRAAKCRLDAAAEQLLGAVRERSAAKQEAKQARKEALQLQQALHAAAAGAAVPGYASQDSSGHEGGGDSGAQGALHELMEARRQYDQASAWGASGGVAR